MHFTVALRRLQLSFHSQLSSTLTSPSATTTTSTSPSTASAYSLITRGATHITRICGSACPCICISSRVEAFGSAVCTLPYRDRRITDRWNRQTTNYERRQATKAPKKTNPSRSRVVKQETIEKSRRRDDIQNDDVAVHPASWAQRFRVSLTLSLGRYSDTSPFLPSNKVESHSVGLPL